MYVFEIDCPNRSTEVVVERAGNLSIESLWNNTNHTEQAEPATHAGDVKLDTNFMWLLLSLISSVLWVVYITYYNSRLVGYFITRMINKFYFQDKNFKIGSFTLNALSGKIMFRDIVYVDYDYTLRIQDGYLIFRWWRAYVPKDVSEDLSHSDTRVSIVLNGFELHFYNRCSLYNELERIFGLDSVILSQNNNENNSIDHEKAMNDANEKKRRAQETVRSEAAMARTWRDLIPVIKVDICSGRVVFGNRLVPTTLSLNVEESHLVYSTKPPASRLDHLMHFVKAKAENCKVMLAPSPNYIGMVDDPPRYMGEGFVVMSSNFIELYFYMDEPGTVPEQPVLLQLANGDIVESAPPIWGIDIKCGKGTDFSYGPWADRQREHLMKFFFPANFQPLEVTPQPKPGDRRQMQAFDIRLSTLNEATIDILFSKNRETNAVHVNIGAGSYLEVTLPWIVLQDGYTTKITGQLLHLEATTSLQYRSLAESETLEFNVKCHYPLIWNQHQCWQLGLTGCKATANIVYCHKGFFQDLMNDWSSKVRPDLLHFIPYTWKISLLLKEFEIITLSNQYNWIDCSSTNQENSHVGFCGDLFDLSFDLPFTDFLPTIVPIKIWIQGEGVDMSLYLPEVNTSRLLLLALDKNMKILPARPKPTSAKWRKKCVKSQGWVDCWSVPIVALSIKYTYHPIPPLGPDPQADITTPEKEEILLSPMRIPRTRKQPAMHWTRNGSQKLDPTTMPADKVNVELEVGPSVMLAYGSIVRNFINLKENIFGEDQAFTDMQKSSVLDEYYWRNESKFNDRLVTTDETSNANKSVFDPRYYRPLDVNVSIIIHDIQAHIVKNCSENEPPCPVVLIERFGFEMVKEYKETKLQLLLSPCVLISMDNPNKNGQTDLVKLSQGHLMLSSLQLRGHAMFSDENRSIDEETLEYAWMIEVQLGQLTGRLTLPQLYQVVTCLETFVLLVSDNENTLIPPNPTKYCHHGSNVALCRETNQLNKYYCPTIEDIKYRMTRISVDVVDVFICHSGTALQTWLSPIRICVCNLHGSSFGNGVTGLLPNVKCKMYTHTNIHYNSHHQSHNTNGSNGSNRQSESLNWLEVGSVAFGPLLLEAATSLPQMPKSLHLVQQKFLKIHDTKTKRLWFLWPPETVNGKAIQCGCTGGCKFFGSNRNGSTFLKPNRSDLQESINMAVFKILDSNTGEYGYGQSLLHDGQLVFHTPPYNGLNICLQGNSKHSTTPSPIPPPPSKSPQNFDRRSLTRRFSYTSVKGSNTLLVSNNKAEVPYARLVDSSATLGAIKIDSDSKLNKSVLSVPQMESSVSDSKLALSCSNKQEILQKMTKKVGKDSTTMSHSSKPNVSMSESHYSLNSHVPQDDALAKVQRALSVTSENHSEAFFSAEEEMLPSRSSSLKHSCGSRHSSQQNRSSFGINDLTNDPWTNSIQRSEPINIQYTEPCGQLESETHSISSTSFISALSSQEDMNLVNLHMQSNKPIIDSPLLMASYIHHLSQFRCANWAMCSLPNEKDIYTFPLFKRGEDGMLFYIGSKYLPFFSALGNSNTFKLVTKQDQPYGLNTNNGHLNLTQHFNSQIKSHPYSQGSWDLSHSLQDSHEGSTDGPMKTNTLASEDSKTGIFIKLRGELDIMLSPIVLESTQKLVESLTPILANIHPISILNHLHISCVNTVENMNILKQERYLSNWLPLLHHSKLSQMTSEKDDKCKLATIPNSNVHHETISTKMQATVIIPKINIVCIQSSIVEDLISFSALDNVQDLTCVSLFSVSIENVHAKFLDSKQTLESVQMYYSPAMRSLGSKKSFGIMKGPRSLISTHSTGGSSRKRGQDRGEPVFIETSQKQCEDINLTLSIGKVHSQLRRLRNDPPQPKDATITGIPSHHSKVYFKCVRDPVKGCDKEKSQACNQNSNDSQEDSKIGYIMFECGLEGMSIKVTKHSQHSKLDDEDKQTCRTESETCYPESIRSFDSIKVERTNSKSNRSSGIDELFRRKDGSKPGTPNLGSANPATAEIPPPNEPVVTNDTKKAIIPGKESAKTSSCIVDLKTVWFNFAAPPPTPITRKIDYTRLDWNLLTTASPAINAWMNPCNRLGIKVVALYRAYYRRATATAASLMAAALDVPQLHVPIKSRYGRNTPMAKQLREEPSLQLCAALLRYALQADTAAVQADLADRHLPSLSTLRQGVIVLSRQWKNILYTPLLLEHNYKTKIMRPLNVTFALPDLFEDSADEWGECQQDHEGMDENSMLLNMDTNVNKLPLSATLGMSTSPPGGHSFASSSTPSSELKGAPPPSSRSSIVFPTLPFSTRKTQFQDDAIANYGALKEDLPTVGSNPSLFSSNDNYDDAPPGERMREDLYSWMAKQDPITSENKNKEGVSVAPSAGPPAAPPSAPACSLYPLQDSLILLDAHLIFQPFLSSLGVSPHQVSQGPASSPSLESLGSNLSLVAWMDMFRIDIVVSEFGKSERKKCVKSDGKGKGNPAQIDAASERPAFLCEKVGVDIDLKRVADMTVDDLIQRQNVLYISRGQLKKHINTILNFNLSIKYISQQVNMPLLRLLHQISNMYQNVKDTQIELRSQTKTSHSDNKHNSSSVSDFHDHLLSGGSLDKDLLLNHLEHKWEATVLLPASITPAPTPPLLTHANTHHKLATPPTPPPPRTRPQSFAQKLRSTGKTVKGKLGYSFLNEGGHTPMFADDTSGTIGDRGSSIVGSIGGVEGVTAGVIPSLGHGHADFKMTPRCWTTVYYLLDLYAAMPDTKTITHRFSMTSGLPEQYKNPKTVLRPKSREQNNSNSGLGIAVSGTAKIHRTCLMASLSGLKLEAEITSLEATLRASKSNQLSVQGQFGRTTIKLLEGVAPNQQTVVQVTVGKSQALYSSEGGPRGRSALLTVGAVRIDLPQHPVALHGMMTRSSKQLSSTLQELGVTRTSSRTTTRLASTGEEYASGVGGDSPHPATPPPPAPRTPQPSTPASASLHSAHAPLASHSHHAHTHPPLLHPLVVHFQIILQSLSVTAALLPSLQAQYKMDHVQSSGVTGNKAHFTVVLPQHSLSFVTKLQVTETNLPSAASIALPQVHVSAQYIAEGSSSNRNAVAGSNVHPEHSHTSAAGTDSPMEGVVLRQGSYLSATADIGVFEHSLSTDLLNHLVFVQKVFMKEVNEVVQKVYGGEKPVPLWLEEEDASSTLTRILFSVMIRIKRIQLTATTPSNSAVRLETGVVEFQLSNRVQNVSARLAKHAIFLKAHVELNLSLGQLHKNAMFEEAEPDFQQYAFFNTRIALRNAFQDEIVSGEDKEVVLITLKRPLIYIQPMAIDKAILVWLNYKNAYEYWNEKRLTLNTEVLAATQQVLEKVQLSSQLGLGLATQHLSTLFLQLAVDDMGICLPLNQPPTQQQACGGSGMAGGGAGAWGGAGGAVGGGGRAVYEADSRGAVVVTLESTIISACSSGSLVSKGRFVGLCLRFADDFETSLDDWKPDMADTNIMNLCTVSEGTYEVCSRTVAAKQSSENAKWFLNVSWQMEGVDIHLDVNVGKQLSALGHTLTMLTGYEEEDPMKEDYESDFDDEADISKDSQDSIVFRSSSRKWSENLPAFVFDTTIDAKKRSKLIEKEMTEQVKIIRDLKTLGASHGTIEHEMKRLHELEALVYKDFRRDMIQKLRRQSVKASSITKGKLGLGSNRSRSFIVPTSHTAATLQHPSPLHTENVQSALGMSLSSGVGELGESGETLLVADEGSPTSSTAANVHNLADIVEGDSWSSIESSPLAGPSRTASLRERVGSGHNRTVTFNPSITRQSSLPTGGCGAPLERADSWDNHIHIQGEPVQLRRKPPQSIPSLDGPMIIGASSQSKKTQEPNIDFELDVKVLINSGKCVLHTKDPLRDEEIKIQQRMRKERSSSGGLVELQGGGSGAPPPGSPSATRKPGKGSSHHHHHHAYTRTQAHLVDLTIFHIPGLDVKVHYKSKTVQEDSTLPHSYSVSRKAGIKKAALFAWMTLQSIPEETIISPHILEFLEQTLEPIPTKSFSSAPVSGLASETETEPETAASYGQYVYASFPVDVIVYFHMQPSTFRFSCLPVSRVECMLQLPSLRIVFSSKRALQQEVSQPAVAMGGLSVTGCLADFSVYIFHPYGGKKSGPKEAQWSPLSDSERKDSLSINVEFVKFHLSRSRKLDFQADQDQSRAIVRFSTIVDIGSASFKYDMRRLIEILAFPKAWYRRSIVRRLFLGDLSLSTPSEPESNLPNNPQVSPLLPQKEKFKNHSAHSKVKAEGVASAWSPSEPPSAAWETLVLFAVNFTKLNVHMNMGNVMGNVSWLSRDFHCTGRLNIGSTGHRNMYVGVGLGGSTLDAKGGIVGGTISLSTIDTHVHIMEEPGCNPGHQCGVKISALELRLDYMGTSILMARISSLGAALRDEWMAHIAQTHPHHVATARPATILVHGTLTWQQLQLLISRSTTPDLLKMQVKLEEFFNQQFKSSKRVFSSLHPLYTPAHAHTQASTRQRTHRKEGENSEVKHHRHWQKALSLISGMQLSTLPKPLPANGTVLGGTMELQGCNISLACFHGNSFKSKSWALFSLKDPCIRFATEAQHISKDQGVWEVHVVQSLTAVLGEVGGAGGVQHESMATVCRMSRNVIFPPQFKTLREWFHYAFSNSDIDAVECFPSLERESGSMERDKSSVADKDNLRERERESARTPGTVRASKLPDPHHTREVIFALPSLQLHLRTQHLQQGNVPSAQDEKPVVECSFVTEFEDHIFVSVDAEAFLFLHDLISSYLKEKARVMSLNANNGPGRSQSPEHTKAGAGGPSATNIPTPQTKLKSQQKTEIFNHQDWRDYRCITWHLEPTVRLLSWAGKSIEPYGVDYILQKLGFAHARTTIPKWLQRGTLDPLDKLLALVLLQLVAIVPHK